MQLLELVIFAALAGVVLFQLYAVLGRRVGRQPEDAKAGRPQTVTERDPLRVEAAEATPAPTGAAAIKARDPAFDAAHFLDGAREAYAMIVRAFASGDRDALRPLTAPVVFRAFDQGITAREQAGRTETVEFLAPPRADLEDAGVTGDQAHVKVRFLAEVRSRTKDASGEGVDDRRTAELWTFERSVNSRDPNWTLTRVDAAEH